MHHDHDRPRVRLPGRRVVRSTLARILADPDAILAGQPGDGAPVFFAPSIGYYAVIRYQDVEEVFRDPAAYSAAVAQAAGRTEFDLVAALAFPLPANIVFSMIGRRP